MKYMVTVKSEGNDETWDESLLPFVKAKRHKGQDVNISMDGPHMIANYADRNDLFNDLIFKTNQGAPLHQWR
jgi:hypothetical protein